MEIFCKNLKEHVIKIIKYEKKEMIPLTNEEKELYSKQKACYIRFCKNLKEHITKIINYEKKGNDTINIWRKRVI